MRAASATGGRLGRMAIGAAPGPGTMTPAAGAAVPGLMGWVSVPRPQRPGSTAPTSRARGLDVGEQRLGRDDRLVADDAFLGRREGGLDRRRRVRAVLVQALREIEQHLLRVDAPRRSVSRRMSRRA